MSENTSGPFKTPGDPYGYQGSLQPGIESEPVAPQPAGDKVGKKADRTYKVAIIVLGIVILVAIAAGVWLLSSGSNGGEQTAPTAPETSQSQDAPADDGSEGSASNDQPGSVNDDGAVAVTDGSSSTKSVKEKTDTDGADADADEDDDDDAEHTHDYVAKYKTVHHKAVTHVKHYPTTYKLETTEHTICNTCGAEIDGKAAKHIKDTGHSGYTKNVPVTKKVVDQKANDVTVVDKKAYDETKLVKYKCVHCGKKLSVKQMKKLQAKEDNAVKTADSK